MTFHRNQRVLLATGPATLVEFLTQDTVIVETWSETSGIRQTVMGLAEIVSGLDFPQPLEEARAVRAKYYPAEPPAPGATALIPE